MEAPDISAEEQPISDEIIAVITAAITAFAAAEGKTCVIKSARRAGGLWINAARLEQTNF